MVPAAGRGAFFLALELLLGFELPNVAIRRLRQKDTECNWKVADIVPQPSLLVSEKVRVTLARLTGIYALEDEGE